MKKQNYSNGTEDKCIKFIIGVPFWFIPNDYDILFYEYIEITQWTLIIAGKYKEEIIEMFNFIDFISLQKHAICNNRWKNDCLSIPIAQD